MCLEDDHHVQLMQCVHGAFHLRLANTTLHLTREQVVALYHELDRCVQHVGPADPSPPPSSTPKRWPYDGSDN